MKIVRRKQQERLYRQWSKHADLPTEVVPAPEMPTDVKTWIDEGGRFYRLRVGIVNAVRKILRVE